MDTANITGSTCLTLYHSKDLSYRLFIKVKVLIFVLNYTLLHLQALELEQSLPPFLPMDYSDQCLAPCYTTFLR